MPSELAISPRNLGTINLPSYCPACFRYLLELRFKPPFNGFGGRLFGDAQRAEEAILGYYLQEDGCLPKEFHPFCDCVERVECSKKYQKYRCTHESGIVLYGEPDEVLRRKDGSVCILDHKTARNRGDDDKFHGQYEIQVIGYTYIAEQLGLGDPSNGGLLYWEAQPQAVQEDPSAHYRRATLSIPFTPSPLEIEVDFGVLKPLIKELQSVWSAAELPEGRTGCPDCKKREILLAIDEEFRREEHKAMRDFAAVMWESKRREVKARIDRKAEDRRRLFREFLGIGEVMFSGDGMAANWEFLPFEQAEDVPNP